MTDMACAWGLGYKLFDVDTHEIVGVEVRTGCGQKFEDVCDAEILPMTEEIKQVYLTLMAQKEEEAAQKQFETFLKEVEEYNRTNRVQRVGQIVTIKKGKYNGHSGVVKWIGKNKFKKSYGNPYQHWKVAAIIGMSNMRPYTIPAKDLDLVLVRQGDFKAYVPIEYCEVTEGFAPLTLTIEDVKNYRKLHSHNLLALQDHTYDRKSYV
jgi:hypothetical protein